MRRYLIFLGLITFFPTFGQQIPFAQYDYVNPLLISAKLASDNYASATVIHNNQKIVESGSVLSTNVFGKYPIVNRNANRLTFGLSFNENRVKGPAAISDQQFSATLAYGFKPNKLSNLAFSMDFALVTRRINWDGVQTGSMWTSDAGFDPSASPGESLGLDKIAYPKLNASLYWNYTNSRSDDVAYLGVAIHQLNTYHDSFYDAEAKVSGAQVFVSGGIRLVENGHLSIMPKLLFYNKENLMNFRIGADFNYAIYQRYNRKPRNTNSLNLGVNFQIEKGAQFSLQYLQPKYIVGIAYHLDTNFDTENNIYNNAVEVLFVVRNPIAPKPRRGGKINGLKRIKPPKQKKSKESSKEIIVEKQLPVENIEQVDTPVEVEASDTTKITDPILEEENKPMQNELDKWRTTVGLGRENQINFEFNSTEVSEDSYNTLVELAELLKVHASATIILIGHTDDIGEKHINRSFSVHRAQSVKEILVDLGTPTERIIIQGRGEEDPIAENKTPEGRRKNRRVDFVIIE